MMQESIDYVNSEDLVYDYKKMIPANTFDAHRLAHFEEGLDIGDHDTLSNLAAEIGLDKSKVLDMLNSDSFLDVIEKDKLEAIKLNFELIPTIIFEDGTIINVESNSRRL
ncbi:MAG: hypothetical protein GX913_05850 [Clostridiales bacterium]|nr:hypothetical protein [Clostridiales bacterium]